MTHIKKTINKKELGIRIGALLMNQFGEKEGMRLFKAHIEPKLKQKKPL